MIFNQVDLFLNSINSYASLFRGNCFIANISKNEIEQAFTQNSKYQDYDFDFLFDHARNFVNELNGNSENHNFNEIERFYNSKLNLFYSDLIDVFGYTKSIESNFNDDTGLFGSEFEDKMNTIAFGLKNVAEIVLDGLKQYFKPPLSNEIMGHFHPFDEYEHNLPPQQTDKHKQKSEKVKAPVLALFCSLINEIGIDKKEETESAPKYCKRICEKYSFLYTDRVRQNYYGNRTKQTRKVFIEKVLPLLDAETKSKIQKYLDTKYPPTQNVYA
jgi:hypothetical protein